MKNAEMKTLNTLHTLMEITCFNTRLTTITIDQ